MPFWVHGWEGGKAFCTAAVQNGDLWGGSVGMEWGAGEDVPATFQKRGRLQRNLAWVIAAGTPTTPRPRWFVS